MAAGPRLAPETMAMPGAVYSPFADRLSESDESGESDGPIYPLHVGDTWRDPFVGARCEDILSADHPRLHAYGNTRGLPELVSRVCEKLRKRNDLDHRPEEILVTAGATGGLATLAGATLSPGDEILILAPFWPLIRGIAQSFRATPVEVPFYDRVSTLEEAVAAVESKITSRSRVLYVSTPSNPTGRVIPGDWLEALAALARRHDLWIFSDEVYEDYVYTGEHVSMARFAPERTVSVYSVSKSYAMAGQRVGYLAGPESIISEARKIGTHIYYHAPIIGQRTAIAAIEGGDAWIEKARAEYQATGAQVAERLGLPTPEGGTFLFLDVSARLDDRGMHGLLEDCFAKGVLVAPGLSCGEVYGDWIRLSYTAAPPDDVLEAATRLAEVLGRG
jgi:aspartate/methionine/tyrosine aminotransferase